MECVFRESLSPHLSMIFVFVFCFLFFARVWFSLRCYFLKGELFFGCARMDEIAKMESHLSSAAAFVEGGVQDVCEDACSICLEAFCDSDPSTVTSCKHEFHLQCILEWCQRSSQCPMCWQPISLKDPASQELLEAVEKEREIRVRVNQTRNTAIFHHPALGDFELQHLPVGTTESELEERIIQHLAAAAAMGRAHHISRREGQRVRSAAHGRPQFVVFSTNPNAPSITSVTASSPPRGEDEPAAAVAFDSQSVLVTPTGEEVSNLPSSQAELVTDISSGSNIGSANRSPLLNNRVSAGQSTPVGQDRAGPSDFQSFSESLKSRLNSVSMRYKESITKSTRGWKERLFSRNSSMADIRSEVKREVSAGIASVSRMMERLDTRENGRSVDTSNAQTAVFHTGSEQTSERVAEDHTNVLPTDSTAPTFYAATSHSRENGRSVDTSNAQTAVVHTGSEQTSERVAEDNTSVLPTASTAPTFYAATSHSN